jgi:hypothetical protein
MVTSVFTINLFLYYFIQTDRVGRSASVVCCQAGFALWCGLVSSREPRLYSRVLIYICTALKRYYDNWCGGSLEYLDDGKCAKVFPAETADRAWSCAGPSSSVPTEVGFQADTILADVAVDTMALDGVVNDSDVNLCVIVTQRVANVSAPSGVTLYNKYLCAGDYSATVAYETWSR